MKKLKFLFSTNFIVKIGLSVLIGYIIGLLLSYINIFGSSQNAPLMCAIGAGIFSLMRIKREILEANTTQK